MEPAFQVREQWLQTEQQLAPGHTDRGRVPMYHHTDREPQGEALRNIRAALTARPLSARLIQDTPAHETAAHPKRRGGASRSALPRKHKGELKMRARPRADQSYPQTTQNSRNEAMAGSGEEGHPSMSGADPRTGQNLREEVLITRHLGCGGVSPSPWDPVGFP